MTREAEAYCAGWKACQLHLGLKITNPHADNPDLAKAWAYGFDDAYGKDSWIEPDPTTRGYDA